MTYIYLFETPDYVYCGQHRCADDKDPMTDDYKGSGKKWTNYLKENNWWLINDFRKNIKKTILEIVMDDTNRTCIGNVEKYWISWARETYGDKCLNISIGSKPSTWYETAEEAKKARKETVRKYHNEHKKEISAYNKSWEKEHKEERKEKNKIYCKVYNKTEKGRINKYKYNHSEKGLAAKNKYNQSERGKAIRALNSKIYNERHRSERKVSTWARNHSYPNPEEAKFPKGWSEEDKLEYVRQWKNHEEEKK